MEYPLVKMWWQLVATLLAASTQALSPAPIQWGGLSAKTFILVPQALPDMATAHATARSLPQPLMILDRQTVDRVSPSEIPYFSHQLDQTIIWDSTGMCMEASGHKIGDMVRVNRCTGAATQLWTVLPYADGEKRHIQLKDTNQCMSFNLAGPSLELQECSDQSAQSWKFQEAPSAQDFLHRFRAASSSLQYAMISSVGVAVIGALGLAAWLQRRQHHSHLSQGKICSDVDQGGVSLAMHLARFERYSCWIHNFNDKRMVPAVMVLGQQARHHETHTVSSDPAPGGHRLNETFIWVLGELSDITSQQQDPWRSKEYERALKAIIEYPDDITDPSQLEGVRHFGEGILRRLHEYNRTGDLIELEEQRIAVQVLSPTSRSTPPLPGRRLNEDFIQLLADLSSLMTRQQGPWKSKAYHEAAEAIRNHSGDIVHPIQLKGVRHIGKGILNKLHEYIRTGAVGILEQDDIRQSLEQLTRVYGIGPKKAQTLIDQGVTSLDDLQKRQELLTKNMKLGLKYLKDLEARIPREEIDECNQILKNIFDEVAPPGSKFEIVGSYRRRAETSGDIDVIITNDENNLVVFEQFLTALRDRNLVLEFLTRGRVKSSAIVQFPSRRPRQIDVLFAPREEYAFSTLYFTGSKEFNTAQRQRALGLGYSLNEHGLYHMVASKKGPKVEGTFSTEESIFDFLGMHYLEPEDRNGCAIALADGMTRLSSSEVSGERSVAKQPAVISSTCQDHSTNGVQLLDLGQDLLEAVLVQRPSKRNRSPWVADVQLGDGRIALAHVPSLDMGGLCVTGSKLLLKLAVDRKGKPIGSNAVGAYDTPKCEFILQLVYVSEHENESIGGCWCGAHPRLGEELTASLFEKGLVGDLPEVESIRREVTGIAGSHMRTDFVLEHASSEATAVEVKTVLNTDYNPATPPDTKERVYFGHSGQEYRRAAIFPWGRIKQVGPQGEKVVSARAIKHVDELAAIARGDRTDQAGIIFTPMLFFMVVRPDVVSMRVNGESCPSFAKHVQIAQAAGVRIVAHKVRWGKGKDIGKAFWMGPLPVEIQEASPQKPVASNVQASR